MRTLIHLSFFIVTVVGSGWIAALTVRKLVPGANLGGIEILATESV